MSQLGSVGCVSVAENLSHQPCCLMVIAFGFSNTDSCLESRSRTYWNSCIVFFSVLPLCTDSLVNSQTIEYCGEDRDRQPSVESGDHIGSGAHSLAYLLRTKGLYTPQMSLLDMALKHRDSFAFHINPYELSVHS
jgi:hypothetical protein